MKTVTALDARARRAARRAGLVARKSQWRVGSVENLGGFKLVDPDTGFAVNGFQFDLDPSYVIAVCGKHGG